MGGEILASAAGVTGVVRLDMAWRIVVCVRKSFFMIEEELTRRESCESRIGVVGRIEYEPGEHVRTFMHVKGRYAARMHFHRWDHASSPRST